jgi:RNA polymerase sigma factor (sigma-70 family)
MKETGDFRVYNDYELIYLIRMNIDEAKDILFWKYSFLIKSRIYRLGVPKIFWDDYYQEGCLTLHRAIKIFDENSMMTFTNFFEMLLKRRISALLRKDLKEFKNEVFDDFDDYPASNNDSCDKLLEVSECGLTDLEKLVYERIIIYNEKVDVVATELGVSSKSISNAKQRALKKIRQEMNK